MRSDPAVSHIRVCRNVNGWQRLHGRQMLPAATSEFMSDRIQDHEGTVDVIDEAARPGRVGWEGGGVVDGRHPGYFGSAGARLYGCYHAPVESPGGHQAPVIVLCPPVGEEYLRSHRAFLQLAVRLSRAGFPALRFDYRGTGDSSGDWTDFGLDDWGEDLLEAVANARERSQRRGVCLVGLRLGGGLAAATASGLDDLKGLGLWDPVIEGRSHLESLLERHEEMIEFEYVSPDRGGRPVPTAEALGFALPELLQEELARFDASPALEGLSVPLLVVQGRESHWRGPEGMGGEANDSIHRVRLEGPTVWMAEPNRGLVPNEALNAIVRWAEEIHDD